MTRSWRTRRIRLLTPNFIVLKVNSCTRPCQNWSVRDINSRKTAIWDGRDTAAKAAFIVFGSAKAQTMLHPLHIYLQMCTDSEVTLIFFGCRKQTEISSAMVVKSNERTSRYPRPCSQFGIWLQAQLTPMIFMAISSNGRYSTFMEKLEQPFQD